MRGMLLGIRHRANALDAIWRAGVAPTTLDALEAIDDLLFAGDAATRHIEKRHRRFWIDSEVKEKID